MIFDDECNLSFSRDDASLTITMEERSHHDCSVFAGVWQAASSRP